MARPTKIEFDGALYHVMSRGIARMPVFVDDSDRIEFLDILAALVGDGHLVRVLPRAESLSHAL